MINLINWVDFKNTLKKNQDVQKISKYKERK